MIMTCMFAISSIEFYHTSITLFWCVFNQAPRPKLLILSIINLQVYITLPIFFGLFYLLHAQRTRLPLPFIDFSPFISKSFNFLCICWAKNKIPQRWNCLLLDLWSNITGLTPVGKAFIWMSFKQKPSSHSAHSEVFSWRQVCPGHVDGQKTQILSVICPPSVPLALASTHYALTMSQSLQTLGEHSCAFVKVLWSFCRPASFIFSFTDSSVNLFAHAVSFFRMHINIP